MTFVNRETSRESGTPVSLVLIVYGDAAGNVFAYTDGDTEITFDGNTYVPVPMGRQAVEASGSLDNTGMEIDISPNASIVEYFQTRRPGRVATLTIYQGHADDPDNQFLVVWAGRLVGVEQGDVYAKIRGEPVATSLRRPGLRRNYQYGCPWPLYSGPCGATQTPQLAGVSAISGTVITVTTFGSNTHDKYRGGFAQWVDDDNGARRVETIVTTTASTITFRSPPAGLIVTAGIALFLGCNHQITDCRDLHNNLVNFGGQPWIPRENPITATNRYY